MTQIEFHLPRYSRYKKTQIDWASKVPVHWEIKALKYIAKLQSGDTIRPEQFTEDGYPVFGGNGFRGYTKSFNNIGRLPLIGRQGALCGNVNYSSGYFFASEHAVVVYPKSGSSVTWIGEAIRTADFNRLSQSTAQPGISVAVGENQRFPHPPLAEQKAIAEFIDHKSDQIDQTIQIKERQIELLKERKQILIQQAVTRGIFPDAPMRDSGIEWIGEIPAHWEVMANRALFHERVEPGKEELPLLSVSIHSGVSKEEISEDDNIRGRVKIEDKTKYQIVRPGDIAFNMMRAWQGAIGAVRVEGMVSPAYTIAIPCPRLNAQYFEYQYRTPIFIQQMDRYSKGITDFRKRLYWDGFRQLITLVPPVEEQQTIVKFIEHAMQKQDAAVALLERQITKIKEYKSTLISCAVTGKIKVPGVVEPADVKEREIA